MREVDTGLVGTLVVVTVFSWAGEAGAPLAAAVVTVVGGADVAGVADMVGVVVGTVLQLACTVFTGVVVVIVESDGLAWAVFIAVVAVEVEDVEVGVGWSRMGKLGTGVEVTVSGVDVADGRAGACGFAAVVVVTGFAVVVTAGVTLTVFDTMVAAVVITVAGTDVGAALTAVVVGAAATGVPAVVAEFGSVAFKVVQVEGFVSTEAVGATRVGFASGRADEMVLAGEDGAVVVGVPVTGTLLDEHAEETWVGAVSELGTAAGGELTKWAEGDVEAVKGRGVVTCGAGVVGTWTEAESGVEA